MYFADEMLNFVCDESLNEVLYFIILDIIHNILDERLGIINVNA